MTMIVHSKFYLVLSIFLNGLLQACGGSSEADKMKKTQPLARVYDTYLYPEDIEGIGKGIPAKDSINQVIMQVEKWIGDQLVIYSAKKYVGKPSAHIERRVRDFRTALMLEYYEQNLIGEGLDSVVTRSQISDYYTQNKEQYRSGVDWIRCHFIKIKKEVPGIDEVRSLFKSESELDLEGVKLFCAEHKDKMIYALDEDKWIKLDHIRRQIPTAIFSRRYLYGNRILDHSDDDYQYLFKAFELREKDDLLPLSQVRNQISKIVLHQRSSELLKEIRKELYLKGEKEEAFEIYH